MNRDTLPSKYLFASCSTLPVFLTMPNNKSLHMDPHTSRLVDPVTVLIYHIFSFVECGHRVSKHVDGHNSDRWDNNELYFTI